MQGDARQPQLRVGTHTTRKAILLRSGKAARRSRAASSLILFLSPSVAVLGRVQEIQEGDPCNVVRLASCERKQFKHQNRLAHGYGIKPQSLSHSRVKQLGDDIFFAI